jgi:hypothetical protein
MKKAFSFEWMLIIACVIPVFISLDFSMGMNFSADPFNHPGKPSIPISILAVFFLLIFNFLKLINSIGFAFFIIALFLACIEINYGITRQIPLLIAMMIPIYISTVMRKTNYDAEEFFESFTILSYVLVIVKFLVDFFVYGQISGTSFILKSVAIYNYYDYFPIYYCLVSFIAFQSILNVKRIWISSIVIVICIFFIFNSQSRLAMLLIALIPAIWVMSTFLRNNTTFVFFGLMLIVINIFATLTVATFFNELNNIEPSMLVRFEHWNHYWDNVTLISFFFPIFNEYRLELNWGSLHNEPLEIFSYFGLLGVIYYFIIIFYLAQSSTKHRFIATAILFVITIGGFFQNNLTSSYLSVIFGLLIFSLRSCKNCKANLDE